MMSLWHLFIHNTKCGSNLTMKLIALFQKVVSLNLTEFVCTDKLKRAQWAFTCSKETLEKKMKFFNVNSKDTRMMQVLVWVFLVSVRNKSFVFLD